MTALHVSAPEAVVRARLAARQRETAAEVEARIQRSQSAGVAAVPGDLHIVNADALETTARMLCELLQTHTGLRLTDPT